MLDSGFQSPGFRIPRAKIRGFRNPDSLTWGDFKKGVNVKNTCLIILFLPGGIASGRYIETNRGRDFQE